MTKRKFHKTQSSLKVNPVFDFLLEDLSANTTKSPQDLFDMIQARLLNGIINHGSNDRKFINSVGLRLEERNHIEFTAV